jgi:hypothetical protein
VLGSLGGENKPCIFPENQVIHPIADRTSAFGYGILPIRQSDIVTSFEKPKRTNTGPVQLSISENFVKPYLNNIFKRVEKKSWRFLYPQMGLKPTPRVHI